MHPETLCIGFWTDRPTLLPLLSKTLSHVYPGLVAKVIRKNAAVAGDARLYILDSHASSNGHLSHLLERLPDVPTLILIPNLTDADQYRHLLQSRREIITEGDLTSSNLIQSIHHLLERQKLHEQLQKTSRRMKEISIRDDLTHLFNRRHFHELLSQEMKKSRRYNHPLSLALVSLKNFELVNSRHGRQKGDLLLCRAAEVIQHAVREVDIVGRHGDNEFAIILPESDEGAAIRVSHRLRESLQTGELVISIGLAALGRKIENEEMLVKAASAALAEAKKTVTSTTCTPEGVADEEGKLKPNHIIVDDLKGLLSGVSEEAERNYFQALMKTIGEESIYRQYLAQHAERVGFYAERLAQKIGCTKSEIRITRRAGFLHDIGLLAIDEHLLVKQEPLTPTELELFHQHPHLAVEMLQDSPLLMHELDAILHHHERFDGTGYPDELIGEQIPLTSRILAIAESWDAMISSQPYRANPLSLDHALAELTAGGGRQFDPRLAVAFCRMVTGDNSAASSTASG